MRQRSSTPFHIIIGQVVAGETGLVPEIDIAPVLPEEVEAAETLDHYRDAGQKALKNSAIIVLNGGLGTSMGLTRAKSLLKVKDGLSFLEIKMRQADINGARLVFMNSFNTHADTHEGPCQYSWHNRTTLFHSK